MSERKPTDYLITIKEKEGCPDVYKLFIDKSEKDEECICYPNAKVEDGIVKKGIPVKGCFINYTMKQCSLQESEEKQGIELTLEDIKYLWQVLSNIVLTQQEYNPETDLYEKLGHKKKQQNDE